MILIAPYAKKLRTGKRNPKDYPYWPELVRMIDGPIVQVGIDGEEGLVEDFRKNLPISELRNLIRQCKTWIGCDSFFQHLAWDEHRPGIVLWSVSDPLIFGHPENINLLKSRSCLEANQFLWWEMVEHKSDRFMEPQVVHQHLMEFLNKR